MYWDLYAIERGGAHKYFQMACKNNFRSVHMMHTKREATLVSREFNPRIDHVMHCKTQKMRDYMHLQEWLHICIER